MQNIIKRTALATLVLVAALVLILTDFGDSRGNVTVYDCREAHWHPDYPIEVKEQCRKLMYEELKKRYEEERIKRMV